MPWTRVADRAEPEEAIPLLRSVGLTLGEIAESVGVSRRTVFAWQQPRQANWRASSVPHPRLNDLVAVVRLLLGSGVDEAGVQRWLRARNTQLAGERPLDLVANGEFERLLAAADEIVRRDQDVVSADEPDADPFRRVFVSYVREDAERVSRVCSALSARGIALWRDVDELVPGMHWRHEIRQAIKDGGAFLAFFSSRSEQRETSYMRDELLEAITELRLRPRDRPWFIPVRLDPCEVPPLEIGGRELLSDLQYVDVFEGGDRGGLEKLALAIQLALRL